MDGQMPHAFSDTHAGSPAAGGTQKVDGVVTVSDTEIVQRLIIKVGSPMPYLHPCHTWTGTGLAPAHLDRDWAVAQTRSVHPAEGVLFQLTNDVK
jgi:hypothetical protein